MGVRLEVPDLAVLAEMALEVVTHDEPWVTTVRAIADDGLVAEMTWDQVAASVTAIVLRGDRTVVRIEREAMERVQVTRSDAGVHFDAALASEELGGTLTIDIGPTVSIRDTLLRQ